MGIVSKLLSKFKKDTSPQAVATQQYTAPIGPTSQPMAGVVHTPTGRQSYGGGSADTSVQWAGASAQQENFVQQQAIQTQQLQAQQQAEAQRQAQIKQQQLIIAQRVTAQDRINKNIDVSVYRPGTTYRVQTGKFKVPGKNEYIPTTKTFTIGEDWSSREATTEERKQLDEYSKSKQYQEVALSKPKGKISSIVGETKGRIKSLSSEEIISREELNTLLPGTNKASEFIKGGIYGSIGTKGALIKTGVIGVVSAGAGFGIKAGSSVVGFTASKVFGSKVGTFSKGLFKLGSYGTGAYLTGSYGLGKVTQLYNAPTAYEKGIVAGSTASELVAGGVGFKYGSKGYDVLSGLYKTRGRNIIDIPMGEYPKAPTSKQVKMFKTNLYPELSSKPGAFHTTPNVFWSEGTITPLPGTSELPGLYASTQISTPFAKIQGSSYKIGWLPKLSDIFSDSSPGVAYLVPEGFRYSPYKKVPTYNLGEQPFNYKFINEPKAGFADIPLMKTEIETIFRPGAGEYSMTSNKFYTEISGVRVPLDVFEFSKTPTTKQKNKFTMTGYTSYQEPKLEVYRTPKEIKKSSKVYTKISYTNYYPKLSSSITPSTKSSKTYSRSYSNQLYSSVPSSKSISTTSYKSSKKQSSLSQLYPSKKSYLNNYSRRTSTPINFGFKFKPAKQPKIKPFKQFRVMGRRFGKFKTIGITGSEKEAFGLGSNWAKRGLGVTFKVLGSSSRRIPTFKTKTSKQGILYLQQPKYRLSSGTEKKEIQFFKGLKGGKKKKLFDF